MKKQVSKLFNIPIVLAYRLFSDEELMKKVKGKDSSAFDVLYERYVDRVWSFIFYKVHNKERTFELTQDVFLKLFNKSNFYDDNRRFSSWFWSLIYNHLTDDYKSKDALSPSAQREDVMNDKSKEDRDNGIDNLPVNNTGADLLFESVLSKFNMSQIRECFIKLPLNQSEVLSLKIFSDLSVEEIGHAVKKKSGAVKSLLFRARDSLKLCLERSGIV